MASSHESSARMEAAATEERDEETALPQPHSEEPSPGQPDAEADSSTAPVSAVSPAKEEKAGHKDEKARQEEQAPPATAVADAAVPTTSTKGPCPAEPTGLGGPSLLPISVQHAGDTGALIGASGMPPSSSAALESWPVTTGAAFRHGRLGLASHRMLQPMPSNQAEEQREDAAMSKLDEQARSLRTWALLVITALLASSLSFFVDEATWLMGVLRNRLMVEGGWNVATATTMNVIVCVLARLLVRTAAEAEGSGIPEVKTMLFGKKMENYLTMRVLFVKTVGLTAVVGAGLPMGKEGPFVHLASCITANLDPLFHQLDGTSMTPVLLAACAVGVGTTFSSPLGGVIFAIELMLPQIYDLPSYWGCFVASVCGSVMYAFWKSVTAGATGLMAIMSTDVKPGEGYASAYPMFRLLLDVILGVICGFLGGFWVRMHSKLMLFFKRWRLAGKNKPQPRPVLRKQPQTRYHFDHHQPLLAERPRSAGSWAVDTENGAGNSRWSHIWSKMQHTCHLGQHRDLIQVATVAALNTLLSESLPLLQGKPQPLLLSQLFSKDLSGSPAEQTESFGPATTMTVCMLIKWFMTSFSLCLPAPCGVVAPTMIIGAFIGRVYAGMIPDWLRDMLLTVDGEVTDDMRGSFNARFAIVGAAAFCASVTRAFAMAITVFEVLALPNSVLPLSCASLISIFCANYISPGFFDQLLLNKDFAGVTAISSLRKAGLPAFRLMRHIDLHNDCLPQQAPFSGVERVFKQSQAAFFPLVLFVPGSSEALLVGTILRESVQKVLEMRRAGSDTIIDFMDPGLCNDDQLVNRTPLHVTPKTPVKEVYLLMKVVYHEPAVFVTSKGRLLGIIDREVLLGKQG